MVAILESAPAITARLRSHGGVPPAVSPITAFRDPHLCDANLAAGLAHGRSGPQIAQGTPARKSI